MLFRSVSVKSIFRVWAPDAFDTVFTHSGHVHDVFDTDCWTQSDSIHGGVSVTFIGRFLTKQDEKSI